jgi:regulatory protein
MHITALQVQATNPNRINIFVDGHFLLGVNALIVLRMALAVGQELSPAQVAQLEHEEAVQQAIERAMNYLSYRPRSSAEVRRYLRRKETPPALIDEAIAHLEQIKLLDDANFSAFWVETREQFSPRGARALKNELRMKGVAQEVVDEVVDDEQDEQLATRAATKKALSLLRQPGTDYATFRNRLGSFLQRRGFSYEVTKRVVKELWEQLQETDVETDDAD